MSNSNNYLDVLNKLKFNSTVGEKQKVSSADPNMLVLYRAPFADKNPEYEIRLRFLFDMERGDPNPICRNWHNFKSAKDGVFMSIDCPDGRCPICNGTYRVWQSGDAFAQDRLKKDRFMRNQTWYINCYVINNPVEPSQNGTVKILKMNKPIMEVFKRATSGRDAKRFGNNIFRLDEQGNTFVMAIKDVRGVGGQRYPQFSDSYFAEAEDCADDVKGINDDAIDRIYGNTFNLGTYFKKSTVEEAQKVFDEHVYPAFSDILGEGKDQQPAAPAQEKAEVKPVQERRAPPMPTKPIKDDLEDDDLPFDKPDDTPPPAPEKAKKEPTPTKDKATSDEQVDDLLKEYGIGNL